MPRVSRSDAAGREGCANHRALQVCEQGISEGENQDQGKRHGNWRRRICSDCRALLGRERRADHAFGGGRREGWSKTASWRRIQAAYVALRFSGHGGRRAETAAEGEGGDG